MQSYLSLCHSRQEKDALPGWSHLQEVQSFMNDIITYDALSAKLRLAVDVSFADAVLEAKHQKDKWQVIEMLVKEWSSRSPEEFQAYKVYINDTRQAQLDKKFGQTKNKDQDRRLLLVFPQPLMQMIRSIYKANELSMDKKFFAEFARRFAFFKIPEKI